MRNYVRICFLALMLIILASGCKTTEKEAETPDRFEKWRIMAENSPKTTPDPRPYNEKIDKDVQDHVEALEQQYKESVTQTPVAPEKELPKNRLTMRMHDVPVAVLLRTLARAADVNILINETVSGQAKINIKNVPWDQAFTGLLDAYGLTYKWSGDILRVITVEDLNKEIALMEAKQKYQKSKNEHSLAMREIARKQEKLEPLLTRVIKVNFADLDELRDNLEKYLMSTTKETAQRKAATETGNNKFSSAGSSVELRGSILKDKNTNCLIVHATKADLDKIIPIIRKLDRPSRQILIEAHIVEATSDAARELGVKWGGLSSSTTDNSTGTTRNWIGSDSSDFTTDSWDENNNATVGNVVNSAINNLATAGSSGLSLGLMTEKVGQWALYTQLTALQEEGKVNILSKPSISTLDHHKATIESGKDVPFQTVEDGEVSIEWRKAVISLEVTPHVINDDIVRLEILTHKDELDFSSTVDGNPTITTKNAETMVNLFDGQTTVIGGLNKENVEDSKSGIPWLMNIPGLGSLFRNTYNNSEMEELLIFITPHILKGQAAPDRTQSAGGQETKVEEAKAEATE